MFQNYWTKNAPTQQTCVTNFNLMRLASLYMYVYPIAFYLRDGKKRTLELVLCLAFQMIWTFLRQSCLMNNDIPQVLMENALARVNFQKRFFQKHPSWVAPLLCLFYTMDIDATPVGGRNWSIKVGANPDHPTGKCPNPRLGFPIYHKSSST